jgi:hypothetical protein
MSNSTNSMNNNTSTSNIRRNKKHINKNVLDEVAKYETVDTIPKIDKIDFKPDIDNIPNLKNVNFTVFFTDITPTSISESTINITNAILPKSVENELSLSNLVSPYDKIKKSSISMVDSSNVYKKPVTIPNIRPTSKVNFTVSLTDITPTSICEKTINVTNAILPKNVEVELSPTNFADSPIVDTKPNVNIFELRNKLRSIEDPSNKTDNINLIDDLSLSSPPLSSPPLSSPPLVTLTYQPPSTCYIPTETTDNKFTKVDYIKTYKYSDRKQKYIKSNEKHPNIYSTNTSMNNKPKEYQSSNKSYQTFTSNTPKQPTNKECKFKAQNKAQTQLISECLLQFKPKICEKINLKFKFVVGENSEYGGTFVVAYDNDSIVIDDDDNGEKYEFSRTRFFENRFFQDVVREKIRILIPMAWISFFPGRDVNSYCIKISKMKQ